MSADSVSCDSRRGGAAVPAHLSFRHLLCLCAISGAGVQPRLFGRHPFRNRFAVFSGVSSPPRVPLVPGTLKASVFYDLAEHTHTHLCLLYVNTPVKHSWFKGRGPCKAGQRRLLRCPLMSPPRPPSHTTFYSSSWNQVDRDKETVNLS